MKKIMNLICIILCAILLAACMPKSEDFKAPAAFYYCADEISYHRKDGVICAEIRETGTFNDLKQILNAYLSGPISPDLVSPFPVGAEIGEITYQEGGICITVNAVFASLNGIDLTIACNCLAMTVREYTGIDKVLIAAKDGTLGSKDQIILTSGSLTLMDEIATTENLNQ